MTNILLMPPRTGKTERDRLNGSTARSQVRKIQRGDWSREVHTMAVTGRNDKALPFPYELHGKRSR